MYKSFRPRPSKLRRRFGSSIQHVRPLSTEWLKSCDTGRCYTRSPPWKLVNTIARPRRHTAAVETRLLIAKYTSPRRPATVSFDVLMWTGRSKRTISSPPPSRRLSSRERRPLEGAPRWYFMDRNLPLEGAWQCFKKCVAIEIHFLSLHGLHKSTMTYSTTDT